MHRTALMAFAASVALAATPAAMAKPKATSAPAAPPAAPTGDVSAPSGLSSSGTAAATPLTALKPADLPQNAKVVGPDRAPLGQIAKIYVDGSGNVSSVLVAKAGATIGKKVPASEITLSGQTLTVAMDKAAFDALPQTS